MPGVVLFGATGYTGRRTAHALARRGVEFKIVGRSRAKLERLAEETGGPEIAQADASDLQALCSAVEGSRVLVTCVGPFVELGETAIEAALATGCHYVDSCGEHNFVARLIELYGQRARSREIAVAPALGFDEVPADVALALACEGMDSPEAVVTYALPSTASTGTLRTTLHILASEGTWFEEGRPVRVSAGDHTRWAPMPPPLGVRLSTAFPFAIGALAPLHIDFRSFKTFVTAGRPQYLGLRAGRPLLKAALSTSWGRRASEVVLSRLPEGPGDEARRKRWTILAEVSSDKGWRNVVVKGSDLYGVSAEFLAAGAETMLAENFEAKGVLSPVQSVGLDRLQKEMMDLGVTIETYESG